MGLYFHQQSHPQLGGIFALTPSLHAFWRNILFSSSILDTYKPRKFIFQCPISLPFQTVHWVLKEKIVKWFAMTFSSGPCFVRILHHDLSILGGPTWHSSWFHWVRKAVVHGSVWLVFCDCSFLSLCPLMDKDKRLMEADWGGNWVLFWWARSCSVQFNSVPQLCPTLWDPMNCSKPGLPVNHQLPEFTQMHVHGVGDALQPSHPLLSLSPSAPNPSHHQSLFQWVNSLHQVAKVLEFQL